jgi:hypothetical protein
MEQNNQFNAGAQVDQPPDYILASGTDTDAFVNPVYFQSGQTILMWVASILDNRLTMNADGSVANGSILSQDAFDTTYIRCQPVPMLPETNWAEMLVSGAYQEWDQILVTPVRECQEQQDPTQAMNLAPLCQIGGFAKKVNFTFFNPQTSPQSDRLRSGT